MAEINESQGRLVAKIVYYGPALSGKTTNLMQLHDLLNPRHRSELMSFETRGDRTLFFDLLPVTVIADGGMSIKIKLFTVPGQVAHDATRKAVLSRADAVAFVADSQRDQAMSNFESFDNLEKNAGRVGLDFQQLPLVVQFNKQDLADIIPEADLRSRWEPTGLPLVFGSALYGKGVMETFRSLLERTHERLEETCRLKARYGIDREDFLRIVARGGDRGGL